MRSRWVNGLLAVARRIAPPRSRLRQGLSTLLQRGFPGLHARLKKKLRGQVKSSILDSDRTPARRRYPASDLHPALSEPDLLTLPRPKPEYLDLEGVHWSPSSENLEPVVEMNQMRLSTGSVCFVVPVRSGGRDELERTLQSVLRQTDPSWELLFACPDEHVDLVSDWLEIDWRVRRFEGATGTEAFQWQAASVQATTVFVGLLSQGDVVDDDLVKMLGETVRRRPEADVVYTDEARLLGGDRAGAPFHKPDWSPEHQSAVHMVGRFAAIRKSLLLKLGKPNAIDDAAAEYQLVLEATARARMVEHIDEIQYFRSAQPDLPFGGFFPASALGEARAALELRVREENAHAYVDADASRGNLRVIWPAPEVPVTLVILTGAYEKEVPGRGKITLATHFVRSIIERSSGKNYRILVVDDGFLPQDLQQLLAAHGHASVTYPKQATFSFAHKANFATAQVKEGIVILLNDDLEVIAPGWIDALASQAARPEIGAVGGKLQFPDGTLQHAGIALGFHRSAGHIFHRFPAGGSEYAGFSSIDRNYSAVTGAVMAYRKEVFDEVGGFGLEFSTDYNDLDFCLKCIAAGYRIVYTPAANLYHFHNASLARAHDNAVERDRFVEKWSAWVARDPYFSKHFQKLSHNEPLLGASAP